MPVPHPVGSFGFILGIYRAGSSFKCELKASQPPLSRETYVAAASAAAAPAAAAAAAAPSLPPYPDPPARAVAP